MAVQFNSSAEIRKDRLRFTKNTLSSNLILGAIAANAFYFVSIYSTDAGNYYYRLLIGVSIVYNLVFMLLAFLASEGVKGYKMGYAILSILLGILQAGRIFYLPMKAFKAPNPVTESDLPTVMGAGQFRYVAICLCISAVLLIGAGVWGMIETATLDRYQRELDDKQNWGDQR